MRHLYSPHSPMRAESKKKTLIYIYLLQPDQRLLASASAWIGGTVWQNPRAELAIIDASI
jgi:hypothetical protein